MSKDPELLTLNRFVDIASPCGETARRRSAELFAEKWGRGNANLASEVCRERITSLHKVGSSIRRWVNNNVAHLSVEPADDPPPTFDDIDAALEVLADHLIELTLLLRGVSLASATPTIITPWQRAFYVAWAPAEHIELWRKKGSPVG